MIAAFVIYLIAAFVMGVLFAITIQIAFEHARLRFKREQARKQRYRNRRAWYRVPTVDGVLV